ncbi:MAG: Gfo/Idh/MocA family oxidoreductase, partial [Bacteroidales bacterium]|nr:Gfo/Idh/MocA family oxidoreductase [Bacteroidales bacterium]
MNKIRMALIGGGKGSFIGPVHVMAATLDGDCELVAAALSSNPANATASGKAMGLPDERIYTDWETMIRTEQSMPVGRRPDFITIATPNYLHFRQASAALMAGFNVVCDKPLCITSEEGLELQRLAVESGKLFCLTHNYTGYPMVKLARDLVRQNKIGAVRKVVVEYLQGWLSVDAFAGGKRSDTWRTRPEHAGIAGTMADIGTHAFNIAEF